MKKNQIYKMNKKFYLSLKKFIVNLLKNFFLFYFYSRFIEIEIN
jgi:hypothetical protein